MKDEYIIINRTALEKRIEELKRSISICILPEQQHLKDLFEQELEIKTQILSQSTPLIPEIEKAFTKGERYGWDSQKSIGNIDEMKEKIKLQSLDNYISNLKLDI